MFYKLIRASFERQSGTKIHSYFYKKRQIGTKFIHASKKQHSTTFIHASKGDCGVGERVVKEKEEHHKEGTASKKRER